MLLQEYFDVLGAGRYFKIHSEICHGRMKDVVYTCMQCKTSMVATILAAPGSINRPNPAVQAVRFLSKLVDHLVDREFDCNLLNTLELMAAILKMENEKKC